MAVRAICCWMSIVLFISYSAHIFLVISKEERNQLSLPQKSLTALLFLQILFNDPLHLLYAYKSSTSTFIVSEVFMTSFLCGLLCFWIIELASEHSSRPDQKEPHCCSLFSSKASNFNTHSRICMAALYLSMLAVFTLLYITYLYKVQKHPDF